MKRRKFIKKTLIGSAAISMPFILPTGRLYASSGSRMADHVVFVAFAGGAVSYTHLTLPTILRV